MIYILSIVALSFYDVLYGKEKEEQDCRKLRCDVHSLPSTHACVSIRGKKLMCYLFFNRWTMGQNNLIRLGLICLQVYVC